MSDEKIKKVTTNTFAQMKKNGQKISMLTAYDFTMAQILDASGVDAILVGDSASNVMAGHSTTLPITLDQMIYHGASVVRAVQRAFVIIDMPFGSYQASTHDAVTSAIKIMKETGADAIKIEGGAEIADSIRAIINAGIPVCGHLGLTPQSIHKFGGYALRAKEEAEAQKLITDATLLDELGCFATVLEKIPAPLAAQVSKNVNMSIIGIGAGNDTDGQVLVTQDMLGMSTMFKPKFVRKYLNLFDVISNAVKQYDADVKNASFPSKEEQY